MGYTKWEGPPQAENFDDLGPLTCRQGKTVQNGPTEAQLSPLVLQNLGSKGGGDSRTHNYVLIVSKSQGNTKLENL